MKNYEEMAHDVLERIHEYNSAKARKRKIIIRISSAVCSVCIAVIAGFGVWQAGSVDPDQSRMTGIIGSTEQNQTNALSADYTEKSEKTEVPKISDTTQNTDIICEIPVKTEIPGKTNEGEIISEETDHAPEQQYDVTEPEINSDDVNTDISDIKDIDSDSYCNSGYYSLEEYFMCCGNINASDIASISYTIKVPEDGLYKISSQGTIEDTDIISSFADILNGLVPENSTEQIPQWYIDGIEAYNADPDAYNAEKIIIDIFLRDDTVLKDIEYQPFIGNGYISGMQELTERQNTELRSLIGQEIQHEQ